MKNLIMILILSLICTKNFADNELKNIESLETPLSFSKLSVIELSSGRLYLFEFLSTYRLKEVKSHSSFVGIKKNNKRLELYIDSDKIPLNLKNELNQVQVSMPVKERFNIGKSIHSQLLDFHEDEYNIHVKMKPSPMELGSLE